MHYRHALILAASLLAHAGYPPCPASHALTLAQPVLKLIEVLAPAARMLMAMASLTMTPSCPSEQLSNVHGWKGVGHLLCMTVTHHVCRAG